MPAATDPRPGRYGPPDARAKVVADLLGAEKQDILPRLERQMREAARHQWALIGGVAALVLILAGGLGWIVQGIESNRRQAEQTAAQQKADQQAEVTLAAQRDADGKAEANRAATTGQRRRPTSATLC